MKTITVRVIRGVRNTAQVCLNGKPPVGVKTICLMMATTELTISIGLNSAGDLLIAIARVVMYAISVPMNEMYVQMSAIEYTNVLAGRHSRHPIKAPTETHGIIISQISNPMMPVTLSFRRLAVTEPVTSSS